ncbi:MAG TPA: TerC/Alx family metal homeostasis membrane protein [Elusimicrobiota bacterium]|nr:TerC/Alx family metal homeostasis membrane protein [Elusimicrobiota bacterium]
MNKLAHKTYRFIKKSLRPVLAIVFFYSNVIALHAVESNFWNERKQAAQRLKEKPSSSQSFSSFESPAEESRRAGLSPEQTQLLAQLPRATDFDFGVTENVAISSLGNAPSRTLRPDDVNKQSSPEKNNSTWISTLVLPYGAVRDVYLSRQPNSPVVVHIQDAHEIQEAQKNMAAMIQGLREERKINLVGMEGAQGAFALEPYRSYAEPEIVRGLADCFMKKGYVSGAEYAGLTSPHPPLLWGMENGALYESNVQAFKDSIKYKPVVHKLLTDFKSTLERLKDDAYSTDLKNYDKHFNAYKNRQEGLGAYVRYLMSSYEGNTLKFFNLQVLLDALQWEENLDFKQVEKDRMQLVELLAKQLSEEKLSFLVQQSLSYRMGQISYGDYHRFLRNLCRQNNIPLDNFSQLNSYINYVLLAEQINRNELLIELGKLEEASQNALAVSPEQKSLVSLNRNLIVLEKLTAHNMTQPDWYYYNEKRGEILRIFADLRAAGALVKRDVLVTEPAGFVEILKPYEQFCQYAMQRNNALVDNLLSKMKNENTGTAILVAGGFHTDGLTQIFRQRDISYIVVTPKINEVPKESHYLDVFAHDPLPLEQMFSGEKIYLAAERLLVQDTAQIKFAPARLNIFRNLYNAYGLVLKSFARQGDLNSLNEQANALAKKLQTDGTLNAAVNDGLSREGVYTVYDVTHRQKDSKIRSRLAILSQDKAKAAKELLRKDGLENAMDEAEITLNGKTYALTLFKHSSALDSLSDSLEKTASSAKAGLSSLGTMLRSGGQALRGLFGRTAKKTGHEVKAPVQAGKTTSLLARMKNHKTYVFGAVVLVPVIETILLRALAFDPTGFTIGGVLLAGIIFALLHVDSWRDLFRKQGDPKRITPLQFLAVTAFRIVGGMAFIALFSMPGTIHVPLEALLGFGLNLSLPSLGVHALLLNLPIVLGIVRLANQGRQIPWFMRPFSTLTAKAPALQPTEVGMATFAQPDNIAVRPALPNGYKYEQRQIRSMTGGGEAVSRYLNYLQETAGFLSLDSPIVKGLQSYLDKMENLSPDRKSTRILVLANSQEKNAYSLPDGTIIMTWALASLFRKGDVGELVWILLHERNHFVRGHVTISSRANDIDKIGLERLQEYEADQSNMDLMVKLGLNPIASAEAAQKRMANDSSGIGGMAHGSWDMRTVLTKINARSVDYEAYMRSLKVRVDPSKQIPDNWLPDTVYPDKIDLLTNSRFDDRWKQLLDSLPLVHTRGYLTSLIEKGKWGYDEELFDKIDYLLDRYSRACGTDDQRAGILLFYYFSGIMQSHGSGLPPLFQVLSNIWTTPEGFLSDDSPRAARHPNIHRVFKGFGQLHSQGSIEANQELLRPSIVGVRELDINPAGLSKWTVHNELKELLQSPLAERFIARSFSDADYFREIESALRRMNGLWPYTGNPDADPSSARIYLQYFIETARSSIDRYMTAERSEEDLMRFFEGLRATLSETMTRLNVSFDDDIAEQYLFKDASFNRDQFKRWSPVLRQILKPLISNSKDSLTIVVKARDKDRLVQFINTHDYSHNFLKHLGKIYNSNGMNRDDILWLAQNSSSIAELPYFDDLLRKYGYKTVETAKRMFGPSFEKNLSRDMTSLWRNLFVINTITTPLSDEDRLAVVEEFLNTHASTIQQSDDFPFLWCLVNETLLVNERNAHLDNYGLDLNKEDIKDPRSTYDRSLDIAIGDRILRTSLFQRYQKFLLSQMNARPELVPAIYSSTIGLLAGVYRRSTDLEESTILLGLSPTSKTFGEPFMERLVDQLGQRVRGEPTLDSIKEALQLTRFLPSVSDRRPMQRHLMVWGASRLSVKDAADLLEFAHTEMNFTDMSILKQFTEKRLQKTADLDQVATRVEELYSSFRQKGGTGLSAAVALDTTLSYFKNLTKSDLLRFLKLAVSGGREDEEMRRVLAPIWLNYVNLNAVVFNYQLEEHNGRLTVTGPGAFNFVTFNDFVESLYNLSDEMKSFLLAKLLLEDGILADSYLKQQFATFVSSFVDTSGNNAGTGKLLQDILDSLLKVGAPIDIAFPLIQLMIPMTLNRPGRVMNPTLDEKDIGRYTGEFTFPFNWYPLTEFENFRNTAKTNINSFLNMPRKQSLSEGSLKELEKINEDLAAKTSETGFMPEKTVPSEKPVVSSVSPMDAVLRVAQSLGGIGVRFMQVLGQYVAIPPEYEENFSHAYDQSPAMGKMEIYSNLKKIAKTDPDIRKFLDENLVEIGDQLGGGSIFTVYLATVKYPDEKGQWTERQTVLKLRNPNAETFVRDTVKLIENTILDMQRKDLYAKDMTMALRVLSLIKEWMISDIQDTRYLEMEPYFQETQTFTTSNGTTIQSPSLLSPSKDFIRVEEVAQGKTLNVFLHSEGGKDLDVARKGVEAAVESYIRMLTQPTAHKGKRRYLMHSDIHPGNVVLKNDGNVLQWIDRSLYQELSQQEAELILALEGTSGTKKGLSFIKTIFDAPENRGRSALSFMSRFMSQYAKAKGGWRSVLRSYLHPGEGGMGDEEFMTDSLLRQMKKEGVIIPLRIEIGVKNNAAVNRMLKDAGLPPLKHYIQNGFQSDTASGGLIPRLEAPLTRLTQKFLPRASAPLINRAYRFFTAPAAEEGLVAALGLGVPLLIQSVFGIDLAPSLVWTYAAARGLFVAAHLIPSKGQRAPPWGRVISAAIISAINVSLFALVPVNLWAFLTATVVLHSVVNMVPRGLLIGLLLGVQGLISPDFKPYTSNIVGESSTIKVDVAPSLNPSMTGRVQANDYFADATTSPGDTVRVEQLDLADMIAILRETPEVDAAWNSQNAGISRITEVTDPDLRIYLANVLVEVSNMPVDKQVRFVNNFMFAPSDLKKPVVIRLLALARSGFLEYFKYDDFDERGQDAQMDPAGYLFWRGCKGYGVGECTAYSTISDICNNDYLTQMAHVFARQQMSTKQHKVFSTVLSTLKRQKPGSWAPLYTSILSTAPLFPNEKGQAAYATAILQNEALLKTFPFHVFYLTGTNVTKAETFDEMFKVIPNFNDPSSVTDLKRFEGTLYMLSHLSKNLIIPQNKVDEVFTSYCNRDQKNWQSSDRWLRDNLLPILKDQIDTKWKFQRPAAYKNVDDLVYYLAVGLSGINFQGGDYYAPSEKKLNNILYVVQNWAKVNAGKGQISETSIGETLQALVYADAGLASFPMDILTLVDPGMFGRHKFFRNGKPIATNTAFMHFHMDMVPTEWDSNGAPTRFAPDTEPTYMAGSYTVLGSELGHLWEYLSLQKAGRNPREVRYNTVVSQNPELFDRLFGILNYRNAPYLSYTQSHDYVQGVYQLGENFAKEKVANGQASDLFDMLRPKLNISRTDALKKYAIDHVSEYGKETNRPPCGFTPSETYYLGLLLMKDGGYNDSKGSKTKLQQLRNTFSDAELEQVAGFLPFSKYRRNGLLNVTPQSIWTYIAGEEKHVTAERMTMDYVLWLNKLGISPGIQSEFTIELFTKHIIPSMIMNGESDFGAFLDELYKIDEPGPNRGPSIKDKILEKLLNQGKIKKTEKPMKEREPGKTIEDIYEAGEKPSDLASVPTPLLILIIAAALGDPKFRKRHKEWSDEAEKDLVDITMAAMGANASLREDQVLWVGTPVEMKGQKKPVLYLQPFKWGGNIIKSLADRLDFSWLTDEKSEISAALFQTAEHGEVVSPQEAEEPVTVGEKEITVRKEGTKAAEEGLSQEEEQAKAFLMGRPEAQKYIEPYLSLFTGKDFILLEQIFHIAEGDHSAGDEFDKHMFPTLKSLLRDYLSDQGQAYITDVLSLVVKTGKNAKAIMKYGLPAIQALIDSKESLVQSEKDLLDIIAMGEKSKVNIQSLLRGIDAVSSMIRTREDLLQYSKDIVKICKALEGYEENVFKKLKEVYSGHLKESPSAWEFFVKPIIFSQTQGASACLDVVNGIWDRGALKTDKDFEFLRDFIDTNGVHAYDLLMNFILKGIEEGVIVGSLSDSRSDIETYLQTIPYASIDLYRAFKSGATEALKAMRTRCETIHRAIVDGDASAYADDPLFLTVLVHVFPPNITVDRNKYEMLYNHMNDYKLDGVVPSALQNREIHLTAGKYILNDPSNPLDKTPWNSIAMAISEVNEHFVPMQGEDDIVKLGDILMKSWEKGSFDQHAIIRELYRYHLTYMGGKRLNASLKSMREFLNLKKFAEDTIQIAVRDLLDRYKNIQKNSYDDMINKMIRTDPLKEAQSVVGILNSVGMDADQAKILQILSSKLRTNDTQMLLELLGRIRSEPDAGKVVSMIAQNIRYDKDKMAAGTIAQRLVGANVKKMDAELNKKFTTNQEREEVKLRIVVSKRKAHSVIGYNAGVCVAADQQLWDNPNFMHAVLFDENGIAQGGMHLFVVEHEGLKYLSLPGINPTPALLSKIYGEDILDELVSYAKDLAAEMGLEGVLIPQEGSIHSNRPEVKVVIASKSYEEVDWGKKFVFTESKDRPYSMSKFYILKTIPAKTQVITETKEERTLEDRGKEIKIQTAPTQIASGMDATSVDTPDFQDSSKVAPRQFKRDNYTPGHIEELRSIYGRNKTIPKEYELPILIALSHYPELADMQIDFELRKDTPLNTSLVSRPRTFSSFLPGERRRYHIIINDISRREDSVAPLLREASFNAQVGVLGHELAHIVDYRAKGLLQIIGTGLSYLFSAGYKRSLEKKIDLLTVSHGLGWQLHDWADFVLNESNAPESYKDFKKRIYLFPGDIARHISRTLKSRFSSNVVHSALYSANGPALTDQTADTIAQTMRQDNGKSLSVPISVNVHGHDLDILVDQKLISSMSSRFEGNSQEKIRAFITEILQGFDESDLSILAQTLSRRGPLVLSLLDNSTHLFEDHHANGFIGINKSFFDADFQKTAGITLDETDFKVGLAHELRHEMLINERQILAERQNVPRSEISRTDVEKTLSLPEAAAYLQQVEDRQTGNDIAVLLASRGQDHVAQLLEKMSVVGRPQGPPAVGLDTVGSLDELADIIRNDSSAWGGSLYLDIDETVLTTKVLENPGSNYFHHRRRMISASRAPAGEQYTAKWLEQVTRSDYAQAEENALTLDQYKKSPGTDRLLNAARDKNMTVYLITNRSPDRAEKERTYKILQKAGIDIPAENIIFCGYGADVKAHKLQRSSQPALDSGKRVYFADDSDSNVRDVLKLNLPLRPYRLDGADNSHSLDYYLGIADNFSSSDIKEWESVLTNLTIKLSQDYELAIRRIADIQDSDERELWRAEIQKMYAPRLLQILGIIEKHQLNRNRDFVAGTKVYQFLYETLDPLISEATLKENRPVPTVLEAYLRIVFPFNPARALEYYMNGDLSLTLQGEGEFNPMFGTLGHFDINEKNMYLFLEPILQKLEQNPPDIIVFPDTGARPFQRVIQSFLDGSKSMKDKGTRLFLLPASFYDVRSSKAVFETENEEHIFLRLWIGKAYRALIEQGTTDRSAILDSLTGQLRDYQQLIDARVAREEADKESLQIRSRVIDTILPKNMGQLPAEQRAELERQVMITGEHYQQFFPLSADSQVVILDDNIASGLTLRKITSVLQRAELASGKTEKPIAVSYATPFLFGVRDRQVPENLIDFTAYVFGHVTWQKFPPRIGLKEINKEYRGVRYRKVGYPVSEEFTPEDGQKYTEAKNFAEKSIAKFSQDREYYRSSLGTDASPVVTHEMSLKKALVNTGIFVGLAGLFGLGLALFQSPQQASLFFTGYMIEEMLSIDNLMVFTMIFTFFGLKSPQQKRALKWGIVGAVILRLGFIMAGTQLIEAFRPVLYLFGGFLAYAGFKMFKSGDGDEKEIHPEKNILVRFFKLFMKFEPGFAGDKFFVRSGKKWAATTLFAALLVVEFSDVMFAMDSIPAIFAVTTDPFLVFTSNIFAILALRSLYFVFRHFTERFRYLKYGVGGVLLFVAAKMLMMDVIHIPALLSLAVVLSGIVLSIGASYWISPQKKPVETETGFGPARSDSLADIQMQWRRVGAERGTTENERIQTLKELLKRLWGQEQSIRWTQYADREFGMDILLREKQPTPSEKTSYCDAQIAANAAILRDILSTSRNFPDGGALLENQLTDFLTSFDQASSDGKKQAVADLRKGLEMMAGGMASTATDIRSYINYQLYKRRNELLNSARNNEEVSPQTLDVLAVLQAVSDVFAATTVTGALDSTEKVSLVSTAQRKNLSRSDWHAFLQSLVAAGVTSNESLNGLETSYNKVRNALAGMDSLFNAVDASFSSDGNAVLILTGSTLDKIIRAQPLDADEKTVETLLLSWAERLSRSTDPTKTLGIAVEGNFSGRLPELLNALSRGGSSHLRQTLTGLEDKIRLIQCKDRPGLLNQKNEIVLQKVMESFSFKTSQGLDVFVMNELKDRLNKDGLKEALINILIILAGNLVSDATHRIDQEIEQRKFIDIQA